MGALCVFRIDEEGINRDEYEAHCRASSSFDVTSDVAEVEDEVCSHAGS